jgi:hypothetical protein
MIPALLMSTSRPPLGSLVPSTCSTCLTASLMEDSLVVSSFTKMTWPLERFMSVYREGVRVRAVAKMVPTEEAGRAASWVARVSPIPRGRSCY